MSSFIALRGYGRRAEQAKRATYPPRARDFCPQPSAAMSGKGESKGRASIEEEEANQGSAGRDPTCDDDGDPGVAEAAPAAPAGASDGNREEGGARVGGGDGGNGEDEGESREEQQAGASSTIAGESGSGAGSGKGKGKRKEDEVAGGASPQDAGKKKKEEEKGKWSCLYQCGVHDGTNGPLVKSHCCGAVAQ